MSSDYDTQNKIHTEIASGSLQTNPIAIENPNPPPRKDRHDDSSLGASRHSSGKNSSGDGDSSNTVHSQANTSGSTSNSTQEDHPQTRMLIRLDFCTSSTSKN